MERAERWLTFVVAGSFVFLLVTPVAMLLTKSLHRDSRADEKMVALGLGLLFASMALVFLTRLLRSLEAGESMGIESHWGGLGGGLGGWRISRPVGYLFCVMTFGALAAVAVSRYPDLPPPESAADTKTTTTTKQATTQKGTPSAPPADAASQKSKTEPSKPDGPAPTVEGQTKPEGGTGRAAPPPKGQ